MTTIYNNNKIFGVETIYGKIGVKVWVYKGEVVGKRNLSLNIGNKNSFKS